MRWSITPLLLASMLFVTIEDTESLVPRPRVVYSPGSLVNRFEIAYNDRNVITKSGDDVCCESGILFIRPEAISTEDGTEYYKGLIIKARGTRKQRYTNKVGEGGVSGRVGNTIDGNGVFVGAGTSISTKAENYKGSLENLREIVKSVKTGNRGKIGGGGVGGEFEVSSEGESARNDGIKSRPKGAFSDGLGDSIVGEQSRRRRTVSQFFSHTLGSNRGGYKRS